MQLPMRPLLAALLVVVWTSTADASRIRRSEDGLEVEDWGSDRSQAPATATSPTTVRPGPAERRKSSSPAAKDDGEAPSAPGLVKDGMVLALRSVQNKTWCALDDNEEMACDRPAQLNATAFEVRFVSKAGGSTIFLTATSTQKLCEDTVTGAVKCDVDSKNASASKPLVMKASGTLVFLSGSKPRDCESDKGVLCSEQRDGFSWTCLANCEAPYETSPLRPGMAVALRAPEGYCGPSSDSELSCSKIQSKHKFEVLDAGFQKLIALRSELGKICKDDGDEVECDEDFIIDDARFFYKANKTHVALMGMDEGLWCSEDFKCDQKDEFYFFWEVVNDVGPQAVLYCGPNYTGASSRLAVASYTMFELGIPVRDLSSIRVPSGLKVTLFEGTLLDRASQVLLGDAPSLDRWDNRAMSARVEQVKKPPATSTRVAPALPPRVLSAASVSLGIGGASFALQAVVKTTAMNSNIVAKVFKDNSCNQDSLKAIPHNLAPKNSSTCGKGGKALFLRGGRVCFSIAGQLLEGRSMVADNMGHEVGLEWYKDRGSFVILVDGRPDSPELFQSGWEKLWRDSRETMLVLGSKILGVADNMPDSISSITYNGMPIDTQAFAALPEVALDLGGVQVQSVDLGSNLASYVLAFTVQTNTTKKATLVAKAFKDHALSGGLAAAVAVGKLLFLSNGTVGFQIGSAPAVLQGNVPVNDGRQHEVQLQWNGGIFSISVDKKLDVSTGKVPSRGAADDPEMQLVLGEAVRNTASAATNETEVLVGTVSGLVYNGQPVDVSAYENVPKKEK